MIGCAILLGGCSRPPASGPAAETSAPAAPAAQANPVAAVDDARLVAADAEPGNWLTHGRTYDEQRFSPLDRIDAGNVATLGFAWAAPLGSTRGVQATPIVVDGVMYATGDWSTVTAIDAADGRVLWTYDPKVPRGWGVKGCCDVVNRGVAAWGGRVFVGTFDGRLVALDAANGKPAWEVDTLIDRTRGYSITGAPRVVKGRVLIGNGGAENGVRGYLSAYDAATGKLAWRFFTVPGAPGQPIEHPELAIAAPTWKGTDWSATAGGGGPWDAIAFDPQSNLVYFGTANGSPWSRHARSPGGGDNLFLASILALDADTGKMAWFYQTTPGDHWDYDATQHIVLADLAIGGQPRKVLMQACKNGFFYVLDRITGKLLSAEPYVTMNWASRVDPETGRPVENPAADWRGDRATRVLPGPSGGHNWMPSAYSPKTGLFYVPAREDAWVFGPHAQWYEMGVPEIDALRAQAPVQTKGVLLAWDPLAGKARWSVRQEFPGHGGLLATAGNLVLQGGPDGVLRIHAADDGRLLKEIPTGTSISAPPIAYRAGGEQYIAVAAGFGGPNFNMLDETGSIASRYANDGRVIAFRLGGGPVPMPAPLADPGPFPEPPAPEAAPELIARGDGLYHAHCGRCHGMYGSRPLIADLRRMAPQVHELFEQIVLGGLFEPKGMAGFAGTLSADDVRAIHAYVNHAARAANATEE
ncbi:MAG: PQQ-dependent dehydrogenase, methanol/ethanol family [Gammaproteobacteria bacterium]